LKQKNYPERVRARRQNISKQSESKVQSRASWTWIFVEALIFLSASILIYLYRENLAAVWPNYEKLIIPILLFSVLLLLTILLIIPKIYAVSLKKVPLGSDQSEFDREKESLKLEDDTRKTVAQIIGGAVFLIGLLLTFNSYRLNVEKQNLDREGQITDRFTKAVTQLGGEEIAVRLGGLYALERIARDSPKDHWPIMEIISAYIREKSPKYDLTLIPYLSKSEREKMVSDSNKPIKTDVQAALTIIGRRIIEQDPSGSHINLRASYLYDADLKGANLQNADLSKTDLTSADLSDAKLTGANFISAELSGADFHRAHLDSVQFDHANLIFADFSDVKSFQNTSFGSADMSDTILTKADLRNAVLLGVNLSDADLENANLSGVDIAVVGRVDATVTVTAKDPGNRGQDVYTPYRLTFEQLQKAIIDEDTKLRPDLEDRRPELLESSRQNSKKLNEGP
jgi:hypothetical protein